MHHISPSSREGCSYKLGQAFEESSHFGHERVRVDLSRGRFVNNCYVRCLRELPTSRLFRVIKSWKRATKVQLSTCVLSIQIFRERLSKKCTRQTGKALWVVLSSLLFKEV